MSPKLLKVPEVARVLDVTERHVRSMASNGMLPVVRVGRQIRVEEDALRAWIKAGGQSYTCQSKAN